MHYNNKATTKEMFLLQF